MHLNLWYICVPVVLKGLKDSKDTCMKLPGSRFHLNSLCGTFFHPHASNPLFPKSQSAKLEYHIRVTCIIITIVLKEMSDQSMRTAHMFTTNARAC